MAETTTKRRCELLAILQETAERIYLPTRRETGPGREEVAQATNRSGASEQRTE